MQKLVYRILAIIMLVFASYCYVQILNKDYAVKQIMYDKKANQKNSDLIFNSMVYYSQAEIIAVAIYNQQFLTNSINFRLIDYYADQLLQANNRSAQALYFKAVVSDSKGDVNSAIAFVEEALEYDPNNTTYLIGLSVLKISIGDLKQVDSLISKIKVIDPENIKIRDIEDEFDNKVKELNAKSK
jgi:tetratricopeptide (TPR) repeat protein